MSENRDVLNRAAPEPDLTLAYGTHPQQVADVWLPPEPAERAPLVVMWHGGFWRARWGRAIVGPLAYDLAARGYAVAAPEYRRTGDGGGWPATFTDVAAAADALPALIEADRPARVEHAAIVYAGHSAGGHLAVWAAARHRLPAGAPGRAEHPPRIVGVLALAPVLDLADAYRRALDGDAVAALLGGGPDDVPDRYAAADPASFGLPSAPLTIVHGDADIRVPIDMSRGIDLPPDGRLVELPGADHFAPIDPLAEAWPVVVAALEELVRSAT